jgi:cytochrome c-type biogenesis protein CcmH/NrfF
MKYWQEVRNRLCIAAALAALSCAVLMAQAPPPSAPDNSAPGAADYSSATPAPGEPAPKYDEAAFRRVSNRLLCQCGCSYMVLSCNHVDCSSATFIRRTIQTKLAAGVGEDAIVAGFIEQYGPRILPEPPRHGFSLSAWVMPFVVLVLGGILVSYVLWRMKFRFSHADSGETSEGTPHTTSPAQGPTPALVEKYRAQIDRELEDE